MKRSKLFLGVTTAILAVAGVAAAKRYTSTTRFYLTAGVPGQAKWCLSAPSFCITNVQGSQCFYTITIGTDVFQYPLYTKGPVSQSGTRCTNPLLYKTSSTL